MEKEKTRENVEEKSLPMELKIIIAGIFLSLVFALQLLLHPSIFVVGLGISLSIALVWIGVGLAKKNNKARIAAIALFFFELVFYLVSTIIKQRLTVSPIRIIFAIVFILILSRKDIKELYKAEI